MRSSAGNCSHCRYENGETKSKYQSALTIDTPTRSDGIAVSRTPKRELVEELASLCRGKTNPAGDLVECAVTTGAQPGGRVDDADTGTGRRHLRRVAPARAHWCAPIFTGNGSLAFNARATRDTGARPRKSEMY